MGAAEWDARSAFYDSQTMLAHGDHLEQIAANVYKLDAEFPNYERFWKRNIVSSSPRPQKQLGFRPGVHVALRYMSQTSYSVLHNFVQAKRFATLVQQKDYGFYLVNIQTLLLFAGNGLQLLVELQDAIKQHLSPILNGGTIDLFPDWAVWKPRREVIVNYRNYLTHRGLMIVVSKRIAGVKVPHVLSRNTIVSRRANPTAWVYGVEEIDPNSADWVRFDDVALDILNDSIAYTNDVYGRICERLEPHLTSAQYQNAWGWASGLPDIS